MAHWVDGFDLAVAKKNLAACRRLGRRASKVWREQGPLEHHEGVGDDLKVPFPRLARCRPSETVVFAWIVFRSRARRDRVNAQAMKDRRFVRVDPKSMPLDAKRMAHGGFRVLIDA